MATSSGIAAVPPTASRSLRIYALDPLEVGLQDNCITAEVRFEKLRPGPVGERFEVIDYDPAVGRYYSPVDLDHPHVLAQDGLAPSESDPRFHQQMAYAVAMTTLERFEEALGRTVPWGKRRRLRIYPHGSREVNAYFSPEMGALVFGYFRTNPARAGRNLPGGFVFTCLSHDIVAHETTHALINGLRGKFMENTNPDTLAFHEAFADLIAIFQHLSLPGVVENAIQLTRASLDDVKPLIELGRQLSDALGVRGALRGELGRPPDPRALAHAIEPHERGSILVAAVFSAMLAVYRRRSSDLLRIATGGTGVLPPGHVAPDLVRRLASEARRTASHFLRICIRAIDYCPPVDIEFGEFLRAMVTADREMEPADPLGYRMALIEAFRERGIYPRYAFSLAEDSVVWQPFEGRLDRTGIPIEDIRFDRPRRTLEEHKRHLAIFGELVKRKRNRRLFRLDPGRETEVVSVAPLRRIGPDRRIHDAIVVEVMQSGNPVSDLPGAPPFRAGATLIFGEHGLLRYAIYKRYAGARRKERQRRYFSDLATTIAGNAYARPSIALSLARIHRGL